MSEEAQVDEFIRESLLAINQQARALVSQTAALVKMISMPPPETPQDTGPTWMGKDSE